MGLNDPLGNGQTQAGAAGVPAARFFTPVELLEDVRQIFGPDPLACITYFHLNIFCHCRGTYLHAPAGWRVLKCIAHQIGQHPPDFLGIHTYQIYAR